MVFPKRNPVFVLLTDFGYDFAVGSMKGVIISHMPDATIVDLDHSLEKFSIISGGFVLAQSYHYFPHGTIFICVVDPGVGTQREPLYIQSSFYAFVGPNNGIFDFLLEQEKESTIYEINESYLSGRAHTFHGRDLFVPAAIDVYKGRCEKFKDFDKSRLTHIVRPNHTIAAYIDSFGNIKTNRDNLDGLTPGMIVSLEINGSCYRMSFVKTFDNVPHDQLLCYKGSNNTLEIAINKGSAAHALGIHVGDPISLKINGQSEQKGQK